jgi:hypothetical protein
MYHNIFTKNEKDQFSNGKGISTIWGVVLDFSFPNVTLERLADV